MRTVRLGLGILLLSMPFVDAGAALVMSTSRSDFSDIALWPTTCTPGLSSVSTVSSGGIGLTATTTGAINTTTQRNGNGSGGCSYDGWFGNFAPGDGLVWSRDIQADEGTGPITLTPSQAVTGIGAQFMADFYGAFVARLEAFSGAASLGFFTIPGVANGNADNSAVFLGVYDTSGATITSAVLSLVSCSFECADFTINQVSLVPEPGILALLSLGMFALGFRNRRNAA